MKKLLIWGAGDQGTVTLDCALAMNRYGRIDFLAFKDKKSREIPGYLVYKEENEPLNKLLFSYDEIIVATGDNKLREEKLTTLKSMGLTAAVIIHPTAIISPSANISDGTTILAGAIINTNASIGVGCIINTGAIVEHDCIVEDYVNISPKASMAGRTRIGKKAFLGIGCTIIDGILVGKEAIVGAGAVVIRDVPDNVVAVGVPAKII